MKIKFTWVSRNTEVQTTANQVEHLARKQGADVIEWANSDTIANVHNVELIEACWVCGRCRDEHAKNLPLLCSKCFHMCKIKGFSYPTEGIALLNYLYDHSFLDWLS